MSVRVLVAIMFYPRGGSAHAARGLARGLRTRGFSVTLVAGSPSDLGEDAHARSSYVEVEVVAFGPALATGAPLRYEGPAGTALLHPSFEDRPGAPDRVFASLDEDEYERQVRAWCSGLERAGAAEVDVLHLHHPTGVIEDVLAGARAAPAIGA